MNIGRIELSRAGRRLLLRQAPDVEDAGRGVQVRVPFGQRDEPVGRDRAVPVPAPRGQSRDRQQSRGCDASFGGMQSPPSFRSRSRSVLTPRVWRPCANGGVRSACSTPDERRVGAGAARRAGRRRRAVCAQRAPALRRAARRRPHGMHLAHARSRNHQRQRRFGRHLPRTRAARRGPAERRGTRRRSAGHARQMTARARAGSGARRVSS